MTNAKHAAPAVPAWVPVEVRNYVFHTEQGQPIRGLARSQACHPSTIMRQIRKVEQRRDDPLVDHAIRCLSSDEDDTQTPSELELMQALRRLAMPHALLAIAMGMKQGVILHDTPSGEPDRGTPLSRETAQTLALRGWIAGSQTTAKVLRYRITPAGRAALRDLVARSENHARAMAEAPAGFEGAADRDGPWGGGAKAIRAPVQESPVVALARRKDQSGAPFLNRAMVRAAERLREDYEIAQIGRHDRGSSRPDWEGILKAVETHAPVTMPEGDIARFVTEALSFLGPGLSEVAFRCCCLLDGLETCEKQMGWAARSGKVVLRIALQRLVLFYEDRGTLGPKIG
ncbi:DUF6456 domain-containing protein [Thalassorhabdomicrobium marinisediminis]|uniref:DUF6456 domain-containing protein n=1 Tax=Thalassorhabdomicrobium marinisediminis TaxID=2170577 RepID=A0A2T7FUW2_9RHOB|nr:DUF6456 domain-containing protein [Thalassorhabdomicrobium marinisediminis]PVA05948.1 hypothetical protein DC363_11535 [Thalassorhabdomicrobium marinisediminis]